MDIKIRAKPYLDERKKFLVNKCRKGIITAVVISWELDTYLAVFTHLDT